MEKFVKDNYIFVLHPNYEYDCKIKGCRRNAGISFEGNNYCMPHFLEFVEIYIKNLLINDFIKIIQKWLNDDIKIDEPYLAELIGDPQIDYWIFQKQELKKKIKEVF